MAKKLKSKDKAPAFCLKNEDTKEVCLKDFAGRWLVLYFYPKDDTPGCTIEARDFTKENPGFETLDTAVIGISADDCGSHRKFINKYNLKISLLSDPDKGTLKKYGVWVRKNSMGREHMGIERTTYMIDPSGRIAYVWEKVDPAGHAKKVQEKLEELREVM